jgi:transposase InsO family protein
MLRLVASLIHAVRATVRRRSDLVLENLALPQQLSVLAARGRRPRLGIADQCFWLVLRRCWSHWSEMLVVVRPETVVRWHRAGFRRYWAWLSHRNRRPGRPQVDAKVRALIRRMANENATWGAPRIHGELRMLGFDVSERTVSRYMPRRPTVPDALKRWISFLRNHGSAIAAMDFFVVPTATFQRVYAWFAIDHSRRRILNFEVTDHPTAVWVVQQLRETFPFDIRPRHLIFDRDRTFSRDVVTALRSFGIQSTRTSPRSPWQNGIAERWIGTVRRELLDHVVVLGRCHLRHLLRSYVAYYNEDRTHLGLDKQTPAGRRRSSLIERRGRIVASPRVGGLHHRYQQAA